MAAPKFIIVTAIHGRHETVKIMAANCRLPILAVVDNTKDGSFAASLDMKILYHDNRPLSNKWNAGAKWIQNTNYDAVIFLGSDDVLSIKAERSIKKALKEYDLVGFEDIVIWDRIKKTGKYWPGYTNHRKGEPAGAGRAITRQALEKLHYQPWQPGLNSSLDFSFWERSKKAGLKTNLLNIKEHGLLIDIKDPKSLTPIERFAGYEDFDLKPVYSKNKLKGEKWV